MLECHSSKYTHTMSSNQSIDSYKVGQLITARLLTRKVLNMVDRLKKMLRFDWLRVTLGFFVCV